MKDVIPDGEGKGVPLSMRYPEKLLKRIDRVAKKTGNSRVDTIMHALRWAMDEVEERERREQQAVSKT